MRKALCVLAREGSLNLGQVLKHLKLALEFSHSNPNLHTLAVNIRRGYGVAQHWAWLFLASGVRGCRDPVPVCHFVCGGEFVCLWLTASLLSGPCSC